MLLSAYTEFVRNQCKVGMVENLQKKTLEVLEALPLEEVAYVTSSKPFMDNLPLMLAEIWSEDSDSQLRATIFLRKLLWPKRRVVTPPIINVVPPPIINVVVQSGVVPRVVKFLSMDNFPELQFEAAWVLTNIASGESEYTKVVVDYGAVPIFIQLLSSPTDYVREQAVWALGNVAGDSPRCRDLVLNYNAMMPLLSLFNEHTKLSLMRTATWTLAHLFRKPKPSFEQIKPALPFLERLVQSADEEVLIDACWALSYIYDNSNDKGHAVIDARIIPRLIELLSHSSPSVRSPALRTIQNIVANDDDQTVLHQQVLPSLLKLLTNTYKESIKKDPSWTISNTTAGNSTQKQAKIDEVIIQSLVWVLRTSLSKVKKEAVVGLSNATFSGPQDQIKFMVSQGCIKPICDLLTCPNPRIIIVCLEALENILVVGEAEKNFRHTRDDNLYASMLEVKGLEKIENLQYHDNSNIYQKAAKILETFWAEDNNEEGNDENNAMQCGGSSPDGDYVMVGNRGSEEEEPSRENRWQPTSWFGR